jgi:hypothetical protein
MAVSVDRALRAGLAFRPLRETIRDLLDWSLSRPADHAWRAGMDAQKERLLLEEWAMRGEG